jgi:U6 snRNA-associated Sm-like protein LSm7
VSRAAKGRARAVAGTSCETAPTRGASCKTVWRKASWSPAVSGKTDRATLLARWPPPPPAQSKRDILDLTRHVDKRVHVKFQGGREVTGTLRGYDQLVNIVLDDTVEHLRDPARPEVVTNKTRHLGLVVCRGNSVTLVCPADGLIETSNPYAEAEASE